MARVGPLYSWALRDRFNAPRLIRHWGDVTVGTKKSRNTRRKLDRANLKNTRLHRSLPVLGP